jgi:hypothetical protein
MTFSLLIEPNRSRRRIRIIISTNIEDHSAVNEVSHDNFSRPHRLFCFHQLKIYLHQRRYTILDIHSFATTASLGATRLYQGKIQPAACSGVANWTLAIEVVTDSVRHVA